MSIKFENGIPSNEKVSKQSKFSASWNKDGLHD